MRVESNQLVGLSEIAEIAQVTRAAVQNWRSRYEDFPEPITTLYMGPVFNWRDIKKWLVATGRKSYRR